MQYSHRYLHIINNVLIRPANRVPGRCDAVLTERREHLLPLVEDGDLFGEPTQRPAAARQTLEPVVHGRLVPPGDEPKVVFGVEGLPPLGCRRCRRRARRRRVAQSILDWFSLYLSLWFLTFFVILLLTRRELSWSCINKCHKCHKMQQIKHVPYPLSCSGSSSAVGAPWPRPSSPFCSAPTSIHPCSIHWRNSFE